VHRDQHHWSPAMPPAVQPGFDPVMVWPENLAYARAFWSSLKAMFPGAAANSLISGIDVSNPGWRLQSIMSRE
jgi:hypothetical protein